jgi:hypothetical protein
MKPLLAVGLAATLAGCAAAESASRYDQAPVYEESAEPYYGSPPYYRQDQPQYDEPQYHEPRYYRHYGQPGYYYPPRRRTWNGCRPGYTVQDGVCKPYRGY